MVDAIAYIRKHATARPDPGMGDPTRKECIEAMNRNAYRGVSTWQEAVASPDTDVSLRVDSAELIGEGYIARERRAKGGD